MTQAQLYADLMAHGRALTERHIAQLTTLDLHYRPVVNNLQLNSPFWIVAHLAVSENWLVLRGTGGAFEKVSWAKLFNLGSRHPVPEECPPWEEVISAFNTIHHRALAHVAALTDEQLLAPHQALMTLDGGSNIRAVIRHHIRHEGGHAGQLGWLCKLQGLPTI